MSKKVPRLGRRSGVAGSARSSLRLLFVDHSAEPGGAELALIRMVPELSKHRIETHICLGNDGPISTLAEEVGAQVHVLPIVEALATHRRASLRPVFDTARHLPAVYRSAAAVSRLALQIDADAIVAHSMKAFAYGSIAARLSSKPLIWDVHDVPRPPYFTPRASFLFDAMHACFRPKAILVHSTFVRHSLRFTGRVTVLPQGVDLSRLNRPVDAEGPLKLGMAARLAPWKGQHIAIQALRMLKQSIPDATLVLAGAAIFGESSYEQHLRSEISRLGLDDSVTLVGHVSDPLSFYDSVHIALHCSTSPEPFGISILDALAAGRPVIASREGGAQEILLGCAAGRLIAPGRPEELARAVAEMSAGGRAKLRELGQIARQHANNFGLDQIGFKAAQFYWDTVIRGAASDRPNSLADS